MSRRSRKKKVEVVKKTGTSSDFVLLNEVNAGDYCYYVHKDNSIRWGEIIKIFDNEPEDTIMVVDQSDFKYHVVPTRFCAWEEKTLKSKKIKWDSESVTLKNMRAKL